MPAAQEEKTYKVERQNKEKSVVLEADLREVAGPLTTDIPRDCPERLRWTCTACQGRYSDESAPHEGMCCGLPLADSASPVAKKEDTTVTKAAQAALFMYKLHPCMSVLALLDVDVAAHEAYNKLRLKELAQEAEDRRAVARALKRCYPLPAETVEAKRTCDRHEMRNFCLGDSHIVR